MPVIGPEYLTGPPGRLLGVSELAVDQPPLATAPATVWPASRPSLAYQWAFDVTACQSQRYGPPFAVAFERADLGLEIAFRLGIPWPESGRQSTSRGDPETAGFAHPNVGKRTIAAGRTDQYGTMWAGSEEASPRVVTWVEPVARSWGATLQQLEGALAPEGHLLVVTSNLLLARRLPEWSSISDTAGRADARPLGSLATVRRLGAAGWSIDWIVGFGGPASLGAATLSRIAARLGHAALADRLEVRMRASFAERGVRAHLAAVAVLCAVRPVEPPAASSARRNVP